MSVEKRIIQMDDVAPKTSKQKRSRRFLLIILILALSAGIGGGLWWSAQSETMTVREYESSIVRSGEFISTTEASGTVVLPTQVEIVSPREGYAESLLVKEGDQVGTDHVLAVLNVPDLEDELNDLSLSLEQATIEMENIELSFFFAIQDLERRIGRLDVDIAEAGEEVKTMEELAALKSSRQSDYEDALDSYEALAEEREDLASELENALLSKDIDLRKQQAVINQLQVQLASVKEDIQECSIKSPIEGEVLSLNEDLGIRSSLVKQSDSLFIVADRSDVYIDFDVYEQYSSLLEPGGDMTVTIGTDTMNAKISKIARIATMDTDGLSAMVSVRARPDTELILTPGASAVASITLDIQEDVLLLPRGSWLTTGNQSHVYRIEGDKAYKTEITLGGIQGNNVEILQGLKEGDEVITGSYQNYIDQPYISLK